MPTVCDIVRELENNYTTGTTLISEYVDFDMYGTINKIDAYLNSKHLTGDTDSRGRDKPFFNIVIAARNIWFRATDIDRKDINLTSAKSSQVVPTLVANILLKQWMNKAAFGNTLNDWGRTLATYGSAVMKFVVKDGELYCTVIPWNRIICDTVDFDNNVKIEVLEYTPAQLRRNKNYDQEMVEALITSLSVRETIRGQKKDNKANYIKVYEVHGELPLSYITDDEKDEDIYVQQMHVVSFAKREYNRSRQAYDYDDYTLYKGKEQKDPYDIAHLIKEDGRALAIGAVENLFTAQWMTNHAVKLQKDTLDFASLIITQTSDANLAGRNVLSDLMTGDILLHSVNEPLTQLNNQHDITQIQNFGTMWQNISKEITSTPDAMRGDTQPAGTAWRQVEALRQESHSLFEVMKQNKGLAIERMLRNHIIPFLKTKMDTTEEISSVLEDSHIAQFDALYVPNEARRRNNKRMIKEILSGEITHNGDLTTLEQDVKGELSPLGNQRFLKPSDIPTVAWKEILKDFEWQPNVNIRDEVMDTQAVLTTLSTVLQTIARNPAVLQDPTMKTLFGKILEITGHISPVEIPYTKPQPQLSPAPAAAGQNVPTFGQAQTA